MNEPLGSLGMLIYIIISSSNKREKKKVWAGKEFIAPKILQEVK